MLTRVHLFTSFRKLAVMSARITYKWAKTIGPVLGLTYIGLYANSRRMIFPTAEYRQRKREEKKENAFE